MANKKGPNIKKKQKSKNCKGKGLLEEGAFRSSNASAQGNGVR